MMYVQDYRLNWRYLQGSTDQSYQKQCKFRIHICYLLGEVERSDLVLVKTSNCDWMSNARFILVLLSKLILAKIGCALSEMYNHKLVGKYVGMFAMYRYYCLLEISYISNKYKKWHWMVFIRTQNDFCLSGS